MAFTNLNVSLADMPESATVARHGVDSRHAIINTLVSLLFWVVVLVVLTVIGFVKSIPYPQFPILVAAVIVAGIVVTGHAYAAARARGYGVREHDLTYYSGVFWRQQSVQPLARVQHVEVNRGPIEKRAGLASVKMFSAGSGSATFTIPGLPLAVAEDLREHALAHKVGM